MMRWILPIVPMLALLGACSQGPNAAYSSIRSFGVSPEAQQCLAQLGTTKASFTPLPNRYFSAGCNQVNTVRLASLRSDDAKLAYMQDFLATVREQSFATLPGLSVLG